MKTAWKTGVIALLSVTASFLVMPVNIASARPPEPPPIREEIPPSPYKKGIWVDGHWNWRDKHNEWKWEHGYWIPKGATKH